MLVAIRAYIVKRAVFLVSLVKTSAITTSTNVICTHSATVFFCSCLCSGFPTGPYGRNKHEDSFNKK